MSPNNQDLALVDKANAFFTADYKIVLDGYFFPKHKDKIVYKAGFTNLTHARIFLQGYVQGVINASKTNIIPN